MTRFGPGLSRAAAVAAWVASIGAPAFVAVAILLLPPPAEDAWAWPACTALLCSWSVVGGLIVTRRPRNLVAWLRRPAGVAR